MKRRLFFLSLFFLFPLFIYGALGPDVSQTSDGKILRWEEGSRDYHVMFKSLIENLVRTTCPPQSNEPLGCDPPNNPQADACIDYHTGSTYTLESYHIPDDAYVEAAYLIWTSSIDPDQFHAPTDNSVTLSFTSRDGSRSLSQKVVAPVSGTMNSPPSFEFEAAQITATGAPPNVGAYTYRVEITDFMQEIIERGREEEITYDGYSLLGDYNVKNMACTNHPDYVQTSLMVGDWMIFFVYTSEQIRPKKIYVYNGFEAYQHQSEEILVTGFELPDEAELRLTMAVHEGDPGLFGANQGNPFAPAIPEALSISGASTLDWIMLSDICNPPTTSITNVQYVEVFNSISSVYGWEDDWESTPYCVGGVPPHYDLDEMEYGIDVDTFILSAMDPLFAPHLIPGDDHLWLRVGANQDLIYTNLLILSIDTKAPKFNIPPNPNTPDGREKNYCSCASDADAVCEDRPFYFTIKVENWGENIAHNVTVKDALPSLVDYIPGTTEILIKKDGVTGQWEPVEDVNGQFPFTETRQIMDSMYYCDKYTYECQDSVLIRFKVKPIDGILKHQVIENTAIIADNTGVVYHSNSSIPLRLRLAEVCPPITECPEPPKEECGGVGGPQCENNEDCGDGEQCVDGQCVAAKADLTTDAEIVYDEGLNSPKSEGSTIIIPNPSSDLVVGQFTLMAEGDPERSFEFHGVNLVVTRSETSSELTNLRLVHDVGGSGTVEDGDKTLATLERPSAGNANMIITNQSDRYFKAGTLHYFLVVLDAEHPGEVTSNVRFNIEISEPGAFHISDGGTPQVKGSRIVFSPFQFEPDNGFIVTKGLNDPEVPPIDKMRGMVPVLQIRTKSMQGGDTLNSVAARTTQSSVRFGEGIGRAVLYLDVDNDGRVSASDRELAVADSIEGGYFHFRNLNLSYDKGDEKHLIIALDLNLNDGETAQITIPGGRVNVTGDSSIVGLPVTSKEFKYECQPGDPRCETDGGSDGCSCSVISVPENHISGLLFLLALLAGMFSISLSLGKRRS